MHAAPTESCHSAPEISPQIVFRILQFDAMLVRAIVPELRQGFRVGMRASAASLRFFFATRSPSWHLLARRSPALCDIAFVEVAFFGI